MPRRNSVRKSKPAIRTPKLSKHQNGQAYITVQQHRYYLGIYGSNEALRRYQEAIRQLNSTGIYQPPVEQTICKSIDELILAYLSHFESELRPNNHATKEFYHRRLALNHLSNEFGAYLGNDFGPKYLKHIQQLLIKKGHTARYINKLINRIKAFIRWCCSEELIDPTIYSKLQAVDSVKAGKQGTQPAKKILPVSVEDVQAVIEFVL